MTPYTECRTVDAPDIHIHMYIYIDSYQGGHRQGDGACGTIRDTKLCISCSVDLQ